MTCACRYRSGKRIASPTQFERYRVADRRDQCLYATVHPSSMNWDQLAPTSLPRDEINALIVRDDTVKATAIARGIQAAHELPTISGRVRIPYITDAYGIGDRIDAVIGRNCLLQTNIAGGAGEGPSYPWVVGVSWSFDDGQYTELTLSDVRAVPRHGHWYDRNATVRHA